MPRPNLLRTPRLEGRPATARDEPGLRALLQDPEVGRSLGGVRRREEVAARLASWVELWRARDLGPWMFREREGGAFVGYAGLGVAAAQPVAGEVELLYALRPGFWRRGLASEMARACVADAFEARGVAALVAYTRVSNLGSRAVLTACGFRPAGADEHAGLPHVFYRLARRDWVERAAVTVRALEDRDRVWARGVLSRAFGAPQVVSRGRLHAAGEQPGFVACRDGRPGAVLTYEVRAGDLEVVTLVSEDPGQGLGSALLERAAREAKARDRGRLWLVTTNDNARAMAFYEARGLRRVAVHADAVDAARRLKPEIPERGADGVPIRDEIEYELAFD